MHKDRQIYKCEHCKYRTTWIDCMRRHVLRHAESWINNSCNLCDLICSSKLDLMYHQKEHMPINDASNPTIAPFYKCDKCELKFSKKSLLAQHRPTHKNQPLVFKDDDFHEKYFEKHKDPQPVECDTCKKTFNKKSSLVSHIRMHSDSFVCHICGSKATKQSRLMQHMRRHNKEFQLFCGQCKKGFYSKTELRYHVITHSEDKPYECKICKASYRSATSLRNHMKLHADPGTRKQFKCTICNFVSLYKSSLKLHMSSHTTNHMITCELCDKVVTKFSFTSHMKLHSGEKPHACEYCGKAYSEKKYLTRHWIRTHKIKNPYQCKLCQSTYQQMSMLTQHMREKHHHLIDTNECTTKKDTEKHDINESIEVTNKIIDNQNLAGIDKEAKENREVQIRIMEEKPENDTTGFWLFLMD